MTDQTQPAGPADLSWWQTVVILATCLGASLFSIIDPTVPAADSPAVQDASHWTSDALAQARQDYLTWVHPGPDSYAAHFAHDNSALENFTSRYRVWTARRYGDLWVCGDPDSEAYPHFISQAMNDDPKGTEDWVATFGAQMHMQRTFNSLLGSVCAN
jgi:hypothetical protein